MSASNPVAVSGMKSTSVSFTAIFKGFEGLEGIVCSPDVELDGKAWTLSLRYDGIFGPNIACYVSCKSYVAGKAKIRVTLVDQKDELRNHTAQIDVREFGWWHNNSFIAKDALFSRSNGYLMSDQVVLKVDIQTYCKLESEVNKAPTSKSFHEEISSCILYPQFADVAFKVGEVTIPAHKVILIARSEVFRAMFTSNMVEATTNIVEITDFEAPIVQEMLHFMYTDTCKPDALQNNGKELLVIAYKYAVNGLICVCENYLTSKITIQNMKELDDLADKLNANTLKERVSLFIRNNEKVVEEQSVPEIKKKEDKSWTTTQFIVAFFAGVYVLSVIERLITGKDYCSS